MCDVYFYPYLSCRPKSICNWSFIIEKKINPVVRGGAIAVNNCISEKEKQNKHISTVESVAEIAAVLLSAAAEH